MPDTINSNENTQTIDQFGNTLLHREVLCSDYGAIARHVNNKEIDLNVKNNAGHTAFELAYLKNDVKTLRIFLECYDKDIDIELITLIINSNTLKAVHQSAYLYLIGVSSLDNLELLSDKIDFTYRDSRQKNALNVAIIRNQKDTITWLKRKIAVEFSSKLEAISSGHLELLQALKPSNDAPVFTPMEGVEAVSKAVGLGNLDHLRRLINQQTPDGFGLPFNIGIFKAEDKLFTAASNGQIAMLRELVKPQSEGGFGLSIHTKNHNGEDLVLAAIGGNQIEMLRELIKPVADGGFGLTLNTKSDIGFTPLFIAVCSNQVPILIELIKPVELGGFGQNFDADRALDFCNDYPEMLNFIFRYKLQQLVNVPINKTLNWIERHNQKINQNPSLKDLRLSFLKHRLIHASTPQESAAIRTFMDKLAPWEWQFTMAENYIKNGSFLQAYMCYAHIFRTAGGPQLHKAGFEIADMIFRGEIILNDTNGILTQNLSISVDNMASELRATNTPEQIELRKLHSRDLAIMQKRAAWVCQILEGNPLSGATFLRDHCMQILKGNLSPELITEPGNTNNNNVNKKRKSDSLQVDENNGFFMRKRPESGARMEQVNKNSSSPS